MGSEKKELEGPDLTEGVPLSELDDGGKIVGHADGESVLLVRKGNEFFAIGATCSHYSGPLGEGLVVGETVRCPWHHACFSLRTGEAVAAPALHPVSSWTVEIRGSSVFVTGKRSESETNDSAATQVRVARRDTLGARGKIVIVGGGAAGDAAADMLRREGFNGSITVISSDTAAPYDRPNLSKDYLAGNAPEEWLPLRSPDFYPDQRIELLLDTKVSSLDATARKVVTDRGTEFEFDRLLLATGASPIHLDVPGADQSHVHYLRSVADCRAIIGDAGDGAAVVVGASFIGLEAAASLRARGVDVHVVAPESVPMERVFGTRLGTMIRAEHEKNGVVFHLGQTVKSVGTESVVLSNDEEVQARLVVVGIGVRPETALAEKAGLSVDGGVLVDSYLETSQAGIFAAGDIARWPGGPNKSPLRIEHWVVAQRQGQVAARNMLGAQEHFAAIPFFWTHQFDVQVGYLGHASRWDRVDVDGSVEDRDFMIAYRRNGATLAVAAMNRDAEMLQAEAAMEQSDEQALLDLVATSK